MGNYVEKLQCIVHEQKMLASWCCLSKFYNLQYSVLANVNVCHLSVMFVRPTQTIEIFGNVFCWPPTDIRVKFYGDRPRGTPPSGELNTRREPNIAISDPSNAVSRKQCKIGGKLVVISNRNSHMSFRLVPNSVTLDDLEWRNSSNGRVISPNSVAFGRIT